MKLSLTSLLIVATTTSAFAHPGHIEEQGGHDHLTLAAGIVLIAVAITAPIVARILRKTSSKSA